MTTGLSTPGADERLGFRVDGMDCASCVGKIETALGRLGGISEVAVNFATETLLLSRDATSKTTSKDIAKKIRSLGFDVTELPASAIPAAPVQRSDAHAGHDHNGCAGDHGACGGDHDHAHHDHDHGHGGCSGHDHAGHAPTPRAAPVSPPNVSMRVEGMDCASCVGKIEVALARMPDVSDVRVNFTTETLELTLGAGALTKVADIEKTIKSLGFGVSNTRELSASSDAAIDVEPAPAMRNQRWWQTRKGKHVIGLGLLMGSAYVVAQFIPLYAEWIFAAAVIAGVIPFARKAFALATSGSPFSIETLMVVASIGALVIGEAEEAAAVVFLFAVGELLESVAAGRARAGIKALASLVPKTAVLLDSNGGQRTVPASALRVNDLVLVRPGDRVPADGQILQGTSSLDESPITGESVPRSKTTGESVFAGSINVDGVLQVSVEKTASDNTISRIIQLVEQAQSAKAPTARFIENFSRYYTPAVMLIAALIITVPPLAMNGDWDTWIYRGLALLLIACPCALVLSTPAAIASGLAVGTRRGLLIKGGNALETIGKVRAIAFDKTGTLTEGKPRVTEVLALGNNEESDVIALAAAVETGSSHPLAKAIIGRAETDGIAVPLARDASATAGKAVHATVAGRRLAVSSPTHAAKAATLGALERSAIEKLEDLGNTVAVLFDEQAREVLGLIALRDEPRRDAREGVAQLKAMGVRSVMLTGDNQRTAQAIAKGLGIEWSAELLPQDKLDLVNEMKRKTKVAMVGDGINDAPALATADVGIAMGGGTDVAIETADAALLKSRVTDVAHLVALSRATMANIHQNVIFALALKGVFLVTSVLGLTGLWIAVLADTGATAIVTLNALRLLRFKGAKSPEDSGRDEGMPSRQLIAAESH
ncbi:MAG: copper-translocating P-type ATPase [Oceanospirillaceae bacterium]|nr:MULTISPECIES: heavy metal translocating P-type ATPase [Alphaproteobacteria]MAB09270.1 copper-translocating P-type ATPase [Hyphomonas sp.]MAU53283.1 copper-translocating P-type ATPase [Roseovarius sp.]MAX99636.1 copper-translocating P-type ATPase [Oceanospirillaceae bacterium]MBB97921.1 copper-translocating P-type ATPase [Paracoccaceae bacterium]AXO16406.1 cadmium-translocating P-type ATPase [Thalassospira indica]|tara:strand:+ start:6696 stop:9356 length:2661 start_codon:yes stop_codon:yes gene_type:complete